MSASVKIVAILTAKSGQKAALEELLRGMAGPCRAESGNIRWDIWQDPDNPNSYILDELFKDEAGVAAHRATPHFQDYIARINDLASRTAIKVRPFDVA